jgi:hypothetical protein
MQRRSLTKEQRAKALQSFWETFPYGSTRHRHEAIHKFEREVGPLSEDEKRAARFRFSPAWHEKRGSRKWFEAPTDIGEREALKLCGQMLDDKHYDLLLDETGILETPVKDDEWPLCILLKNRIPKDLLDAVRPIVLKAATQRKIAGGNRGVAAESFNRPLAEKINDVVSPRYHAVLATMAATHVVPRAYLWGFADTIRAGMEGREFSQLIFGRAYHFRGPKYFFPAIIAVKVPIGLIVLILFGLFLFFTRCIPRDWILPCGAVLAVAALFLLVLSNGATYAGVRHALSVVVLLSVFAGISIAMALSSKTLQLRILVALTLVASAVSAVPQMRPCEYFNEFVGGTANAYKYFSDEGVDLGQRTKELANYYQRELKQNGLRPDCLYEASEEEFVARGIDCFGSDKKRDPPLIELPERSGTIFIAPNVFSPRSYWDRAALREATPVKRLGNLSIFRGTFHLPGQAAAALYDRGLSKIYGEKPDDAETEKAFRRSVELDPTAYFVHIELGNL